MPAWEAKEAAWLVWATANGMPGLSILSASGRAWSDGYAAGQQAERARCIAEVERDRTWGIDAMIVQRDLAAALRATGGGTT